MFNSRKIKKLNQQQELLDSKINSVAHGQNTLSKDFDSHFKRLRQSIYSSVEELSVEMKKQTEEITSELQTQMEEFKKQNALLNKVLSDFEKNNPSKTFKVETEILKKQNGIINQRLEMVSTSLQVDLHIVKDQISDLKNQISKPIEIPKNQEMPQVLGTPIGVGGNGMPTWTMRNRTSDYSKSSPIQDKMKLELQEIFTDPQPKEELKKVTNKYFYVSLIIPQEVSSYLMNRSSSSSYATCMKNIFQREGKLTFAPLSLSIVKNFKSAPLKKVTISVHKKSYVAFSKIAEDLGWSMAKVLKNFLMTDNVEEYNEVASAYHNLSNEEIRLSEKKAKGRPIKK